MIEFKDLLALAVNRKGSLKAVKGQLPTVADADTLRSRDDAFYLSALTRRIFRAGLKHSLVDNKWPAFEEAFFSLRFFLSALREEASPLGRRLFSLFVFFCFWIKSSTFAKSALTFSLKLEICFDCSVTVFSNNLFAEDNSFSKSVIKKDSTVAE